MGGDCMAAAVGSGGRGGNEVFLLRACPTRPRVTVTRSVGACARWISLLKGHSIDRLNIDKQSIVMNAGHQGQARQQARVEHGERLRGAASYPSRHALLAPLSSPR